MLTRALRFSLFVSLMPLSCNRATESAESPGCGDLQAVLAGRVVRGGMGGKRGWGQCHFLAFDVCSRGSRCCRNFVISMDMIPEGHYKIS